MITTMVSMGVVSEIWSEDNQRAIVVRPIHPLKVSVSCALWAGTIVGPYFFKHDPYVNNLLFKICRLMFIQSPIELPKFRRALVLARQRNMLNSLRHN